jgi:hypothetical protein
MARQSTGSIRIDPNVRCVRIYPTKDSKKTLDTLASVGTRLNREQAVQLARVLLAASQEWETIDITAYRRKRRNTDETYPITVTSFVASTS